MAGMVHRGAQLCQKPLPARVAGGDLRKLYEVGLADDGILVDAIQVWCVPPADEVEFRGPPRRPTPHQSDGLTRVIATYRRRRSSSISAVVPADRSEGRQPSTVFRRNTDFHSCPFAE
jgi:hypothetical protein